MSQRVLLSRRAGFTIVELLVVLAIIAILAGLLLPAVQYARNVAKRTRIGTEIMQLNNAIQSYKERYGDYPPDFTSWEYVDAHIRRAYPRCDPSQRNGVAAMARNGANPLIDPAEALHFWLRGTSPDPQWPFSGGGTVTPLFDFKSNRLTWAPSSTAASPMSNDESNVLGQAVTANDPYPVYIASDCKLPYVYFDYHTYTSTTAFNLTYAPALNRGVARPYRSDVATDVWMNPRSFQIICAGLDDHYGPVAGATVVSFPNGITDLKEKDNHANFNEGRIIGTR